MDFVTLNCTIEPGMVQLLVSVTNMFQGQPLVIVASSQIGGHPDF